MSFKSIALATALSALAATSALADGIMIKDAYARTSVKGGKSGAAFMQIMNHGTEADRLLSVSSDSAMRTELHAHKETGDGVMQMLEVEDGIEIPAGGMHALARGGDHVMFMGLTEDMLDGGSVTVTLTFEHAGDMTVEIPVDLDRKPGEGHGDMDHSDHDHDN